jgi:hypothetical protein
MCETSQPSADATFSDISPDAAGEKEMSSPSETGITTERMS